MAARILRVEELLQNNEIERQRRTFRRKICPLIDYQSDEAIRERFRFGREGIHFICGLLNEDLARPTHRTKSLATVTQVLLALKYFATGDKLISVAENFGVNKGTASRVIANVSHLLANKMDQFITWPATAARRDKIKNVFFQMGGFPDVLGCVDCTRIQIQAPSTPRNWLLNGDDQQEERPGLSYEAAFVGRGHYHSINVQAICDDECRILNIVAKWPGATHDSYIFRQSQIGEHLEDHGIEEGYILGDSGYACRPFLMTPFLRPTTNAEKRYSRVQKRTRATVERCFGILKRRFGVLHLEIRMQPDRVCKIICACAVLHNIAKLLKEPEPRGPLPAEPIQRLHYHGDEDGRNVRNFLVNTYFRN